MGDRRYLFSSSLHNVHGKPQLRTFVIMKTSIFSESSSQRIRGTNIDSSNIYSFSCKYVSTQLQMTIIIAGSTCKLGISIEDEGNGRNRD